MTVASVNRTANWRVHLIVPHAGRGYCGMDRFLGNKVSSAALKEVYDREGDGWASWVAETVRDMAKPRTWKDPKWKDIEVSRVLQFNVSRILCDAGRLWGITPQGASHPDKLSIPADIAGVPSSELPPEMVGRLQQKYRAFIEAAARRIEDPTQNHLVIEIHSFDEIGADSKEQAEAALLFREDTFARTGNAHPFYSQFGMPPEVGGATCSPEIVSLFQAALKGRFPDMEAQLNAPPYNLHAGNLSVRLAAWRFFKDTFAMPVSDFWMFPAYEEGGAWHSFGTGALREQAVASPCRLELLAIGMRKDDQLTRYSYEKREGFAQAIAQAIFNLPSIGF